MPDASRIEPFLVDLTDLCRLLSCNRLAARQWMARGLLPPPFKVTPRGKWLWRLPDVEATAERLARQSPAA